MNFDPAVAETYPLNQVVTYKGSTYQVNKALPSGTPSTSDDYMLLAAAGSAGVKGDKGPTGATGIGLTGIVDFDLATVSTHTLGQVVTYKGSTYMVNTASPTGTPDTSPDYTLLAGAGTTGETGDTGAAGVTGATGVTGDTG
ncbi:hypothetical protein CEY02_03605, partial [Bacillus pumilus]